MMHPSKIDGEDSEVATITLSSSEGSFNSDDFFQIEYGHNVAPPPLAFIEVDGDVYFDPSKIPTDHSKISSTLRSVDRKAENRYERPTGVPNLFYYNVFPKANIFSLTPKTKVDFTASLQCRIEVTPEKVFQYLKDFKNWKKWHSLIMDVYPWNSKGLPKEGYIRTVVKNDGSVWDEEIVAWEENRHFTISTLATNEPTITSHLEEYRFEDIYRACGKGYTKTATLLRWNVTIDFDSWVAQQKHLAMWTFAGGKDRMKYSLDTLAEFFDEESDCKDFEL